MSDIGKGAHRKWLATGGIIMLEVTAMENAKYPLKIMSRVNLNSTRKLTSERLIKTVNSLIEG